MEPSQDQESDPLSSSVTSSSVSIRSTTAKDLENLLSVASSYGAVSRGCSRSSQGNGESLNSVLKKDLQRRLNSLDILPAGEFPRQERLSVITHTPPASPRTSTPSNSPQPPPPVPPRSCQSLVPIVIPKYSCSPSCSELSSINGEVFEDIEHSRIIPLLSVNGISLRENVPPITPNKQEKLKTPATMEDSKKEITKQIGKLGFKISDLEANDIDEETVGDYRDKLLEIANIHENIVEAIDELVAEFGTSMHEDTKKEWKDTITKLARDVRIHRKSITKQALEVKKAMTNNQPLPALDSNLQNQIEAEKLELLKRQVKALELANETAIAEKSDKLSESVREVDAKRNAALNKAKAKYESVLEEIQELEDKVNTVGDWSDESDISIGRAMRNAKVWKTEIQKVLEMSRELKEITFEHNMTEEEIAANYQESVVATLSEDIKNVIANIEREDDRRALFTLDKAKTDPVKLPVFEGKDSEDFMKFKDEIKRGFVINRICRADQLAKLRECLRGYPLKLVPESTVTKIEAAWDVLDQAYKDPTRVMRYKWGELLKLQYLPKESPKGYKNQIEWYMNLENHIRGIIDVGKRDPELALEAFGRSSIHTIFNMIPSRIKSLMMKCSGTGESRLETILRKISDLRREVQEFQIVHETGTENHGGAAVNCASGDVQSSGGSERSPAKKSGLISMQVYNPPRKDNSCRICLTLETEGDTQDLYEVHIHNYATGCPRYIKMSVAERFRIASKAKLCLKCHDPEYVHKKFDNTHKCSTDTRKKGKFTCKSCSYHMWVCQRHQDDNKECLQKFKDDFKKDHKLNFGLIVICPVNIASSRTTFTSTNSKKRKRAGGKVIALTKNAKSDVKDSKIADVVDIIEESSDEVILDDPGRSTSNPSVRKKRYRRKSDKSQALVESAAPCNHKSISTIEATKKLIKKLSADGEEVELRPIPKGRAQFIIGQTKGRSRPLNTLYDTGCYGMLMKEGVQHELGKSVRKTQGPFNVTGVGNTSVSVNDEWQSSLPLRDGRGEVNSIEAEIFPAV